MTSLAVVPSSIEAFDLARGGVVALCGAGGKSTLARRIVAEARAARLTTLLSATTRLGATAAEGLGVIEDAPGDEARIDAALAREGAVAVAGEREGAERWAGLSPERVDALASRATLALVECDGARGRLLKLPAAHEPVVPRSARLLLVVAATGALGRPAAAAHVHRLDIVRAALERAGFDPAAPLGVGALAALLLDAAAYLARVPPGARAAVFLNRRDASLDDAAFEALSERLLARYEIVVGGSTLGGPLLVAARAGLLSSRQEP